jgi:competence protein ComEA
MFRKLLKNLKDYLTFNKSERRGMLVLAILILVILLLNILLPFIEAQKKYDYSEFDKDVDGFLKTQEIVSAKPKIFKQKDPFNFFDANASAVEQKLTPVAFDPNTLSYEGFIDLGLAPKQVVSILKYRTKGGTFSKKEDFKKMYSISEAEYQVLEPYIQIKPLEKDKIQRTKPETVAIVDINTANEADLKRIKGIGDYFAYQIIKYRNKLGGYFSKEQLLEVPKMDSAKFSEISPYVEVGNKVVYKININTATFEQLKEHPYIGYNIALSLINYRDKHGSYPSVSDIKKSALITNKNYPKISYYLCTE